MHLKVWLNNKFKDLPVSPYLAPIMMDFVVRMQVKGVDVLGGMNRVLSVTVSSADGAWLLCIAAGGTSVTCV